MLYDRYILPFAIDCVCSNPLFFTQRRELIPRAHGKILEVGMGSGLNLPHYLPHQVEQFWGLEPSTRLTARARSRIDAVDFSVKLLEQPGEAIPLPDQSIDCVVMTYTLCTIPDYRSALQQIRRVLKPGGELLFAEHGLAPDRSVQKWQRRFNPIWTRFAGGCNLDRAIAEMISSAGFSIQDLVTGYLPGVPRVTGFHFRGAAIKRSD